MPLNIKRRFKRAADPRVGRGAEQRGKVCHSRPPCPLLSPQPLRPPCPSSAGWLSSSTGSARPRSRLSGSSLSAIEWSPSVSSSLLPAVRDSWGQPRSWRG